MRTVAEALAERAVGWRQGVVAQLHPVPRSLSDVDVEGWAAVPEPFATGGTSGGTSKVAAIAEALERHAAARAPLEIVTDGPCWPLEHFSLHTVEQRVHPKYRYRKGYVDTRYTRAWTLPGNEPIRVPAGLVSLDASHGLPSTSSGLAAGPSTTSALLRATQELVERDAFTTTWLHSLAPPRFAADLPHGALAFDLTPAYSPHPVVAVAGSLPIAGRPRPTLGLACRATVAEALRKAYEEWAQGTVFIEVWLARNGDRPVEEVTCFDEHAVHYATHPAEWDSLPWFGGVEAAPPRDAESRGTSGELTELVHALDRAGLRLAYRELTTPELAAVGLHCVRVLSPDLAPLHADHRWPHLGGRARELGWRYPHASPGVFPNPAPHPLG
ncbi:ribosomal protein S12 methylthiotransferase accessory factor [Lentzea xinjiangensis]|uniref:Ribosomal protein S12 methylthiotransferase accessory factor n=1 Tax=Lentzea xinjiangensis TaxID=402600 RepID=A0A1H9GVB9_9PSEU|nr:YcaO-like family protein [Lentzea xinjiangensis]SEQ53933.1 ribosomal protein S12 methylthiotransferase accessory factor [Lentzea xinjiangensis]